MSRIRSKDTAVEMAVRRLLHALGYRYRLHRQDLPGKPDIVFSTRRKVIFVHGCFWHGHGCKKSHTPRTNREYWSPKLLRNAERDAENIRALEQTGWSTLVLWECGVSQAADTTALLADFLTAPGTGDNVTTSKKDASKASKLLRTSKSAAVKSVAGSDLAGAKKSGKKKGK